MAGRRDQCRPDEGRRAISGPLAPVTKGLSRSLTDSLSCRSGQVTGPDGTDSQADSAGSIPVTRSTQRLFGRAWMPTTSTMPSAPLKSSGLAV